MTKNDTKMTPEMLEELWQKREAEYKRRYGINVTQREAKRILEYVSFDFLSLITFMIVYGKYPYHLAYMRIWDVITLLKNINCKNKEKFFMDFLFDGVEFEDEAESLIKKRYCFFIESLDEYYKTTHMYPKRKNLYFKDAPKNIIIFRRLIEKHLFGDLDYGLFQTDFWREACERLFLNKKLENGFDWDFEKLAFADNETTDV
ncbi:MAG: hypothetical protein IJ677_09525 [Alphaproteobacteria bacterium]|nr:hypothetical protein [Alphaproteobacteria bacterium]MBR1601797.1 hypothetical protein [Alphaproteobacteria bacterium]